MSPTAADITDLRTALKLLDQHGELAQTDVEADPVAELCGAYRHIGAGGTVARPTRIGPAMLFNKVKGHPGARVAIGVLSSRKRAALLLGTMIWGVWEVGFDFWALTPRSYILVFFCILRRRAGV